MGELFLDCGSRLEIVQESARCTRDRARATPTTDADLLRILARVYPGREFPTLSAEVRAAAKARAAQSNN